MQTECMRGKYQRPEMFVTDDNQQGIIIGMTSIKLTGFKFKCIFVLRSLLLATIIVVTTLNRPFLPSGALQALDREIPTIGLAKIGES